MKSKDVVPGIALATIDMVVRGRFRERIRDAGLDPDDLVQDVVLKILRSRGSSAFDPARAGAVTYVELVVRSVYTEQVAARLRALYRQRAAAAIDRTGPLSDATRGCDGPTAPEPEPERFPILAALAEHGSVQRTAAALGRSRWWVYRELHRQGLEAAVGRPGTNQHARRGEKPVPRRRRRSRSRAVFV